MTKSGDSLSSKSVFKPQYPGRIMFTIYLYPIGVIIFFFFSYMAIVNHSILPYGIFAAIFAFTTYTMPQILFREIHFGEIITIKRYFLPSRKYKFEELVEITSRTLVFKRGNISLVNVKNRKELEKLIKKHSAQHGLKMKR